MKNIDKNYVKNIRTLLEGEVEEAEVIMAARGFSKEFQDMIQKVGRLANEQVGPVVDQIRLTYGPEMAESFQSTVRSQMETVLNAIASAKDTLDNVVIDITDGRLNNGGGAGEVDMDTDEFGGDMGGDLEGDMGADLEGDMGADLEGDMGVEDWGDEDEFGGEEPLGRGTLESKKPSVEDMKRQIVEMRKKLEQQRKLLEKKKSK